MITVTINSDKLDTQERKLKAFEIEKEMELVLNSDLFRSKILGLRDAFGETSNWRTAPNIKIWEHIESGREILSPDLDNDLDIILDDYYTLKRVIGYGYPSTPTIYVNTRYFDAVDLSAANHHRKNAGSNFLHEYFHKLGFAHDFSSTSRRPYSLCYLGNTVYEECWDELVGKKLKRVEITSTYRKWFKTYTTTRIELHGSI